MDKFSKYFDHTLLKPDAGPQEILKVVGEAVSLDTAAVCVNGCHVRAVRRFISVSGSDVKVAAVAGFPLGAMASNAKAYEVQLALEDGADEIDLVMNIGQAKAGNWAYVEDEAYAIAEMCHESGAILKLIIETCLLTDDEIVRACRAALAAGADFVKTSTGFSSGGATVHAVALMKQTLADADYDGRMKIKASGGIRTLDDARAMIEAGADRLGCSATAAILAEYESQE